MLPKIGLSLVSVFELSIEQKNHDLVKEEVEILNLELKIKDREIGRMIKKTSQLRLHTTTYRVILNFYDQHPHTKILLL